MMVLICPILNFNWIMLKKIFFSKNLISDQDDFCSNSCESKFKFEHFMRLILNEKIFFNSIFEVN